MSIGFIMKSIAKFVFVASFLFLSMNLYGQVGGQLSGQVSPQMDAFMRQQYTNYLTPEQSLQLAQIPAGQRLQVYQSVKMPNGTYAMQFVPQAGPYMGSAMWAQHNSSNALFNFITAMGAKTTVPERAMYMVPRSDISALRSPDPSENPDPSSSALMTMNRATTKLREIKNPQNIADCLECKTADSQPQFTAPAIAGQGTVKTSGNGQIKEDLNADITCTSKGEVIDGQRLSFAATLELKMEHNQVKHLKYVLKDGNKTCVADLSSFQQRQVGNTTNVVLWSRQDPEAFVVVGSDNKTDRKNPTINVSLNQFAKYCPQMNPKYFMQTAANPKTGTCE